MPLVSQSNAHEEKLLGDTSLPVVCGKSSRTPAAYVMYIFSIGGSVCVECETFTLVNKCPDSLCALLVGDWHKTNK